MTLRGHRFLTGGLVLAGLLVVCGAALAGDCANPNDCAALADNANSATGLAAGAAGALAAWGVAQVTLQRRKWKPLPYPDLEAEVAKAKKEFEDLERALRDATLRHLADIGKLNADYNDLWAKAMRALDDYAAVWPSLYPDIRNIVEALGDRELARKIADWFDTGIQALQVGAGAVELGTGAIARLTGEALGDAAVVDAGAARGIESAAADARAVAEGQQLQADARAIDAQARAASDVDAASTALGDAKAVGSQRALTGADPYPGAPSPGRAVLFGDETNMRTLAQGLDPLPGYYDVCLHGDRGGLGFYTAARDYLGNPVIDPATGQAAQIWRSVSVDDVVAAMQAQGYAGGPVRLIACNTGGAISDAGFLPGVANELATKLGTQVIAPSDYAWLFPNGKVWVGDTPFIRTITPASKPWVAYGSFK